MSYRHVLHGQDALVQRLQVHVFCVMDTRQTRETGILELQGLSSRRLEDCPQILVHEGQNGFQSGMIRIHNV